MFWIWCLRIPLPSRDWVSSGYPERLYNWLCRERRLPNGIKYDNCQSPAIVTHNVSYFQLCSLDHTLIPFSTEMITDVHVTVYIGPILYTLHPVRPLYAHTQYTPVIRLETSSRGWIPFDRSIKHGHHIHSRSIPLVVAPSPLVGY
jgi:hypothetical protein